MKSASKEHVPIIYVVFVALLGGFASLVTLFAAPVAAGSPDSSWTTDRLVDTTHFWGFAEASIATDSNGFLYMAYGDYNLATDLREICVSKSTDGGDTWDLISRIGDPNGDLRVPSIAINVHTNSIFIAYEKWSGSDNCDILCTRCIGGSWSVVGVDTDGDCDANPSVTADYSWGRDNCIHISYESVEGADDRDLMYALSIDQGATWYRTRLQGGFPDYNVHTETQITATHDHVYIAYRHSANEFPEAGESEIWVSVYDYSSDSWNQKKVIDNVDKPVRNPSIAATQDGSLVAVAYEYETSSQNTDIRYCYSTDKGATWCNNNNRGYILAASTAQETSPALSVDGRGSSSNVISGFVHAAYCSSQWQIKYRQALSSNQLEWGIEKTISYYGDVAPRGLAITTQERPDSKWYPCVAWASDSESDPIAEGTRIYYSTPGATYTITTDPLGLAIEVDGRSYTAPASFNWLAGYSHSIYSQSPQSGGRDVRHVWTGWSDDGARSHTVTVGTKKVTVTAHFKTQYYVTIDQSGSEATITARIDDTDYNLPSSFWWEADSSHHMKLPPTVSGGTGTQYVFTQWSSTNTDSSRTITVTGANIYKAHYKTQHYLTMTANFGTPSPGSGWHDEGESVQIEATPPAAGEGERYEWGCWRGSGLRAGHYSGIQNPASVTMNDPITEEAVWNHQYHFMIRPSGCDTTVPMTLGDSCIDVGPNSGFGFWCSDGGVFTLTVPTTINDPTVSGKRYAFTEWSGSVSSSSNSIEFTVTTTDTLTAKYKRQYQLIIDNGEHGTTAPATGNWYDQGTLVTIAMCSDTTSNTSDTRYLFCSWIGNGLRNYTGSDNPCRVPMISPVTEVASWKTQYYLTVGSSHGILGGEGWYGDGMTAYAILNTGTVSGATGVQYVFMQWDGDASGADYAKSDQIAMNAPKTATANWKTQYCLAIHTNPAGLSPQPRISALGPWYDSGSQVTITAEAVTGYTFDHWTLDGTNKVLGMNQIDIEMNQPHEAFAHYTTAESQCSLTIAASPTSCVSVEIDDNMYTTSHTSHFQYGTTIHVTAPSTAIINRTGCNFDHWADDQGFLSDSTSVLYEMPKTPLATLTVYYVRAEDIISPTITHTPIATGNEGQEIAVAAKVTDNVAVLEVILYYRKTGESAYNKTTMTKAGDTYTKTIPAPLVTTAGVQYYINATDGSNFSTDPTTPSTSPHTITISAEDSPPTPVTLNDTSKEPAFPLAWLGIAALVALGTTVAAASIKARRNQSKALASSLSLTNASMNNQSSKLPW